MINAEKFERKKEQIFRKLAAELSSDLTYHNVSHTQDVLEQCEKIALNENVRDEYDLMLLRTAALYHDTGFLFVYKGHEEMSCKIFKEDYSNEFTEEEIEKILGIIMATKIPQTPHNLLEKIICDADLDYLGREDFEPISNNLRKEFLTYNIVSNNKEWEERQIKFFEMHKYFTASSNNLRNKTKELHLQELKRCFAKQYGN